MPLSLAAAISLASLSTSLAQSPKLRPGHPYQAAAFEVMRLRSADGTIATNGLINAIQQVQQMPYNASAWPGAAQPATGGIRPKVADLNTNNWQSLGPGNVGGRIRSIVIHPTIPSTLWVGCVGGGVWKSTNSAASWFPCNNWMANLAVACMVLDPTNPNVLYAGTGEGFGNADAIRGAGVFKSIDGGINWTQLTSYALQNNINRLAICPTNNLVLLAATGNGIWRSVNGGTNWTQTYNDSSVKDIAFHPTNGGKAIATPDGLGLYSTDAGQTWTAATGLAPFGRIEFAYAPSSPNIVYASQDTNQGSLFLSTDGGVTYTLKNTGQSNLVTQGWYGNSIWVDPTNPNNLIIGGVNLYHSTDGGVTLTPMSDWTLGPGTANIGGAAQPTSAHADHHAIVSAPGFNGVNNTTVYFGNDGGLACATNVYTVTTNSGWTFLNNNLGITQLYGVAGNPTTLTIVSGNQDNGSTRWTTTSGTTWNYWGGGDGGFCAADPTDPNYFYGEYVNLQIYRSTDGGVTETYIFGNGLTDAGVPDGYADDDPNAPTSANFIAPFILDPNNPNTMLGGGSNLWRSVNIKTASPTNVAWANIKSGVASGSFISAIAVAKSNSDIIWVGYNDGEIYATANGTAGSPTWVEKDSVAMPGSVCTRLAIDPTNSSTVYATFGGFNTNNVYRTTDGGTTWTNIAGGLPAAPVYSIVIAPFNSSYIYVGTDVGVFGSANSGATWSPANEGPANVQVQELTWVRNYLVAGTHGLGAYWIALGPPTVVVSPAVGTGYSGLNFTFTASAIGTPTLNYQWQYDGNNLSGATGPTFTITNAQPTNAGLYRVIVSNSEGTVTSSVSPLTIISSPPYRTQTLASGPVAYWRLNETSGTTAFDSVGGFDGTDIGSLIFGVSGPAAPAFPGFENGHTAYQFDGATTSVSVPALNLNTNTVTITGWVNCSGVENNYPGILTWQGSGSNRGQFLFDVGNNQLGLYWNGNFQVSTLTVPINQWTFVALVISPSNSVIYMATNSTLASWTNTSANANAAFDSVSYLGNSPYSHYTGGMADVAIYNQSLTASQIGNLLSASLTSLPAVTLTAPADSSFVSASPNILLTAPVTTNGHAIGAVKFYDSAALLGQSTTPPYQFTWSGATSGIHTLLAQVTYDGSSTISSAPANITVTNTAVTVNTTPTNIVASVSGGTNLNLSWPTDHIGWRLLMQTNNLATGISANTNDWGAVAGSASTNQISIAIDPTKPTEFYRLIYP